jgi:hypothetical protein
MVTWFVSVSPLPVRGADEDCGWTIRRFSTLHAAKTFAREALLMGYQIEAGTADGVEPEIRILSKDVEKWASTPDPDCDYLGRVGG